MVIVISVNFWSHIYVWSWHGIIHTIISKGCLERLKLEIEHDKHKSKCVGVPGRFFFFFFCMTKVSIVIGNLKQSKEVVTSNWKVEIKLWGSSPGVNVLDISPISIINIKRKTTNWGNHDYILVSTRRHTMKRQDSDKKRKVRNHGPVIYTTRIQSKFNLIRL